MSGVAWFLVALSLSLASTHGTWGLSLTVGLAFAVDSTTATILLPGTALRAY